jgi:aldose 1-epimerase
MVAKISDFGGVITQIHVPDRDGVMADVVLGFDDVAPYMRRLELFRRADRPLRQPHRRRPFDARRRNAQLDLSTTANHLHGGTGRLPQGAVEGAAFARMAKSVGPDTDATAAPDGEQGYPGNLDVTVVYTLTRRQRTAWCAFHAMTDKATPVNLTQHSYFNLAGAGRHPRPPADHQRRRLHPDRRGPDPGGAPQRWPAPLRLPHAARDRRTHRCER